MNFDDTFPLKLCINLTRREDRRFRMDLEFYKLGMDVLRVRAVNQKYVRRLHGYPTAGRYANALSHRLALRRAKLAGVSAVLIFEDDVVFAPDFHERLADIELPEDWGIFYLGCRHWQRPESAGQRLVRVTRALDTHAYAVRAEHFERLLRAFRRPNNPGSSAEGVLDWGVDFPLKDLQRDIPTYACWPNLAWQQPNNSDLATKAWRAYGDDGKQLDRQEILAGVNLEATHRLERPEGPFLPRKPLRLHLGCGGNQLPGWKNLDLPDLDITQALPFASGSTEFIFLEHVIEHVKATEAWEFFEECQRVLVVGGVLRLAFPCVEKIWREMTPEYAAMISEKGWGDGSRRAAMRAVVFEHGHQAVWTAAGMSAILESIGFTVLPCSIGESSHPELCGLEQHWTQVGRAVNEVETVCLEACKPT